MKYVSIDLETGGLNPAVHPILELGAVATEVGSSPARPRHTLRLLVVPPDMNKVVVTPYTALLHKRLWEELEAFSKTGLPPIWEWTTPTCATGQCYPSDLGRCFWEWLDRCQFGDKVTVAGKNAATFDLPFLRAQTDIDRPSGTIRHRVLDVTPMFYRPGDDVLPDLNTCLQRAGIPKATLHGALDDALLVCELIDAAFKNILK